MLLVTCQPRAGPFLQGPRSTSPAIPRLRLRPDAGVGNTPLCNRLIEIYALVVHIFSLDARENIHPPI